MKRWIGFLCILFLVVFCFSTADARPAPNLSAVQITHVGADNTGWIPAEKITTTTLQGQQFYIAVQFTGYPNPDLISLYQNGHLIPKSVIKEPFGRKGLGNPYTGWVYQFAMPISYGNGTIAVGATGINGGRQFSTVHGVTAECQP